MIVAVNLAPAIDRTLVVDRLVPGGVHRVRSVHETAGGKGANVARVAHALGHPVVLVAVGGGRYTAGLDAEAFANRIVESPTPPRVCTSIADGSSATTTDLYEPATPVTASEANALVELVAAARHDAAGAGWVSISGSLAPGIDAGVVARIVREAHADGWRVAVDSSGEGLRAAIDARPDLVKVNAHEAAAIVGPGAPGALAVALAAALDGGGDGGGGGDDGGDDEGAGAVAVVTDGVRGAHCGGWHVPAATRGTFAVGCGDAFLAGMLVALDRGGTLPDALRLASGAASANALTPGAGRLDPRVACELATSVSISPSGR